MRRMAGLLLLVSALWMGVADPAAAHNCASDQVIPLGQMSTLQIGVTIPDHGPTGIEVTGVDVTLPAPLRIDRIDPKAGWTIAQKGQTIEYRGPAIKPGDPCPIFFLGVTPTEPGAYQLRIVQFDAAGNVVGDYGADPTAPPNPLVPTVYAGVDPPSPGGDSVSTVAIAGAVLVGIALLSIVVMSVRSRRLRRAEERDAEIDERVEEFKKQARDRQ
jgi:uncharacterized protein YcnI